MQSAFLGALFIATVLLPAPLGIALGREIKSRAMHVVAAAAAVLGGVALWLSFDADRELGGGHVWETRLALAGFVALGFGLGALGGWMTRAFGAFGWVVAILVAVLAVLFKALLAIVIWLHLGGFA